MKRRSAGLLFLIAGCLAGCKVGPAYVRPQAYAPPAFQEAPPEAAKTSDWTTANPADSAIGGDWWKIFEDPELDGLEVQVAQANQSLKAAEANFRAARAAITISRSQLAPTLNVGPTAGTVRDSTNQPYFNHAMANDGEGNMSLPLDMNYEVDLWGRIRRSVTAAREQAQASAADLATARLSLQAELALNYFNLRSVDAQTQLLNDTVKAYEQALQLTQDRYEEGISPRSDVSQAQTQLEAAEVIRTDLESDRAMDQHVIAILIGKAPEEFHLDPRIVEDPTEAAQVFPDVPTALPSQLLERRPDIASMERHMAAANEQIGIAMTAYYPTLSLSGSVGFLGTSALNWFSWPSRFWAIGTTLSQTAFDAGRRHAGVAIAQANYDATVADYRQTVLISFQQVEDNLAALRVLESEAQQQHAATHSAEQTLDLFQTRYEGGVDTYLQVITSQTATLQNQRNDIQIQLRREQAIVLLVKALGGGWSTKQLPRI